MSDLQEIKWRYQDQSCSLSARLSDRVLWCREYIPGFVPDPAISKLSMSLLEWNEQVLATEGDVAFATGKALFAHAQSIIDRDLIMYGPCIWFEWSDQSEHKKRRIAAAVKAYATMQQAL